ncbi:hypothetical protein [Parasitella parasitica]|uniref:PiggyBac transposable element-derived protein domain-containing protein n=1 Tax=Parasitella parasitica TaxID=35722 RepID=A0A0B7MN89_9FUNG|nr:hypothetical protein [Parasitella parasitica]
MLQRQDYCSIGRKWSSNVRYALDEVNDKIIKIRQGSLKYVGPVITENETVMEQNDEAEEEDEVDLTATSEWAAGEVYIDSRVSGSADGYALSASKLNMNNRRYGIPLDYFLFFISVDHLFEIINNTNAYARSLGHWVDITFSEYLMWITLLTTMNVVRHSDRKAYWKQGDLHFFVYGSKSVHSLILYCCQREVYKTCLWPHWGDTVPIHLKNNSSVYIKLDFRLLDKVFNAHDWATGDAGINTVDWKYFTDKTKLVPTTKSQLNEFLTTYHMNCQFISRLKIPFIQLLGANAVICYMELHQNGLYKIIQVISFEYPTTKNCIRSKKYKI